MRIFLVLTIFLCLGAFAFAEEEIAQSAVEKATVDDDNTDVAELSADDETVDDSEDEMDDGELDDEEDEEAENPLLELVEKSYRPRCRPNNRLCHRNSQCCSKSCHVVRRYKIKKGYRTVWRVVRRCRRSCRGSNRICGGRYSCCRGFRCVRRRVYGKYKRFGHCRKHYG